MKSKKVFIWLLFLLFFQASIYSQEIETLNIDDDIDIEVTNEGKSYNLIINRTKIEYETNYLAISTTPDDFKKPAFIYVAYEGEQFASPDNRDYSSQELGINIIYINMNVIRDKSTLRSLSVFISSLEETKVRLQAYYGSYVSLEDYPLGFRHKYSLLLTPCSFEFLETHFELNKGFNKTKKVLFYALGEYTGYFNLNLALRDKNAEITKYEDKQIFENGYGAIIEITPDMLGGENKTRIRADSKMTSDTYENRKVELGYEIVDNAEEPDDQREVNILEHVYGIAETETCYKVKNIENRPATMLLNTFTQSVLFNIRNSDNEVVYSLDVFNNYFIRLPKEFYDPTNHFCFKHVNSKESDEEIFGEVSYDFQIYYEDELSKYQMFIAPLINGKIYTHSLNRGDIMIYRNSFFNKDYSLKTFIYSVNMLRVRGNPRLYGFTCNEYPNCAINSEDLKNSSKVENILPLNMYHINKRLKAEGNFAINEECAVPELRKQYMTIISCESDESDPNKGECKYNIEINNEGDEIQLVPETVFTSSIYPGSNNFLIKLNDYQITKYLKIYFTVLIGNAEISITNKYTYTHIYKKEILEIVDDLKENNNITITCTEPALIQIKYETDAHYKGYEDLRPNEVNIVPNNKQTKTYYNMFNPHYYFPLNDEKRNNDFYYRIIPMECTMNIYYVGQAYEDKKELEIKYEKNKLYEYLTTYGFFGVVNEFSNTALEGESCTLLVYNGEISENRPLLVNADIPHKSTSEETYYVFPIVFSYYYGILIEFKIYDKNDKITDELYSVEIFINEQIYEKGCINITKDDVIFINETDIKDIIQKNYMGRIFVKLTKKYPKENYYITTNFIGSQISIEYFYPNINYVVNMMPYQSKFFYTQVSKNSEGQFILFGVDSEWGKLYAKLVTKTYIQSGHDYNGRVVLPNENDPNVIDKLDIQGNEIKYEKSRAISNSGYEIYFNIDYSSIDSLSQFSFYFKYEIIDEYITDLNYEKTFTIEEGKMRSYKITYTDKTKEENIVILSTSPLEYVSPGFFYIGKKPYPSSDDYNYKSVQPGINQIILSKDYFLDNEVIYLDIKPLVTATINFKISLVKGIALQELNTRAKVKLSDSYIISFFKNENITSNKVLLYALGEKINYFEMKVELIKNDGEIYNFEVKQIFENGYGVIVDYSSAVFISLDNPKIYIKLNQTEEKYKGRKVEVGYEIIDNAVEKNEFREVKIWEHVYGLAEKETCYKVNNMIYKDATMLINTFSQSVLFKIKNSDNEIIYSLDIFNNYFIRLTYDFHDSENHFCFKHINSKESDEEIFGEVSYDFQIYYEDELSKYQMFIAPLINGKIYTHSLNRGDIMIYRNSHFEDNTNKIIYSANMLRIRGEPKLYAYTCTSFPECVIKSEDLTNSYVVEKITPLNMYHINKRQKAPGNTEMNPGGLVTSELRTQYMTIVSCESDESDPNKGECKYTIEINNEGDEIQLIPETVFATSIISPENYFLIRLKDFQSTSYLKIHFTVLTGNAELFIYDDIYYNNEIKQYSFSHIHRKEIIEISENLKDNYYLKITCAEQAFIQLKYETNAHYKGYEDLMPNEVNIVPINSQAKTYYNMFNPHYYYPLSSQKNKDFYYSISTLDCSMDYGYVGVFLEDITNHDFVQEKNVLYSYLSTYGFFSQINKYLHTSLNSEKCGLIIYNGEKSENRPLLLTSDMPHKSTFVDTYYVYPVLYDSEKGKGIIMEFKLYDKEDSLEDDLYTIEYNFYNGAKESSYTISKDKVIYLPSDYFLNNMLGNLYINIHKKYPERKYYITTNVINSKISPEYLPLIEKEYDFYLRPSSSKYFYSPISKDSVGYIKFHEFKENIILQLM